MDKLTRQEASALGRTRYFTGNPCPRMHVAERMVSTRACCECVREKKHRWSAENPDKVNAQKRAYRNANLEKVKAWNLDNQKLHRDSANARTRKWYAAHRDEVCVSKAAWQKAHLAFGATKAAKRRAAKLRAIPLWADQDAINRIYDRAQTFRVTGQDVHVDHIVPLQGKTACGLHVHDNLQIIEAQANRSKSNSLVGGL